MTASKAIRLLGIALAEKVSALIEADLKLLNEPNNSNVNFLLDCAIEELQRHRTREEPPPPPTSSLISPRPTSGPVLDLRRIPVLDTDGRSKL